MPCPVCIGTIAANLVGGAAAIGIVKHVKNKKSKSPKKK